MLIFLDFEASGLSAESWPIEIGAAWLDGDRIEVRSELVRPHPDWPASAWSPQSAEVHGITRQDLDAAEPAEIVAARFARLFEGARLVADAPEYDERWLARLMATLPSPPLLRVHDFDVLAVAAFGPHARDWVYESLARSRRPHRAGPDARRLARAWREGRRRST